MKLKLKASPQLLYAAAVGCVVVAVIAALGMTRPRIVERSDDETILTVVTPNSFFDSLYRGPWQQSNFELVGTLSASGADDANVGISQVVPIYSRPNPAYRGRNLYFTKTDSFSNSLPVPIYINGKNCMGNLGCDLIGDSNDQVITVPTMNSKNWMATLYK